MKDDQGFADRMNTIPKYVVSTMLKELSWNNSRLIKSDVPREVYKLKQQIGQNILVAGSIRLVQTLMQNDLIDEYRLMVHPLVVGGGKRLFNDGIDREKLSLIQTQSFSSGIVTLHYMPTAK